MCPQLSSFFYKKPYRNQWMMVWLQSSLKLMAVKQITASTSVQ